MPTKAKMRTIAVCPTADSVGGCGHRRYAGLMNQMPVTTRTMSGRSLATVVNSTSRAPTCTPRTLVEASAANSAAITTARPGGVAAGDHSSPTDAANALDTDATANVAVSM